MQEDASLYLHLHKVVCDVGGGWHTAYPPLLSRQRILKQRIPQNHYLNMSERLTSPAL